MNKKTCILFVFALGLALMIGCGGGGGDDSVPQSSPSYMGSSLPAVMDTSTGTQSLGLDFLSDVSRLAMQFGGNTAASSLGSTSSSTSDSGVGGDGGSFTYSGSSSASWDETSYNTTTVQSISFNDFADSGGIFLYYSEGSDTNGGDPRATSLVRRSGGEFFFPDLQAGRGSMYRSLSSGLTTDGVEPSIILEGISSGGTGAVGSTISHSSAYYLNYGDLFIRQGYTNPGSSLQQEILRSGSISSGMSDAYDSTVMYWSFEDTISADYAVDFFSSYSNPTPQPVTQYTQALMNFSQNHAWDLSTATFISSGTYCAEGDVMSLVLGCVDFDVSLTWDNDALDAPSHCRGTSNPASCYDWPDDGLITLAADGASASFAYTPTGGTFTFDAGDGSSVFETNLEPPDED